MADTADMIRMSKMMTGTTGEGAGKGVSEADVARLKRMMTERGMSDMEKSNATTDMGAEKASMLKRLMEMLSMGASGGMAKRGARRLGEAGKTMSDADRQRVKEIMGREGISDADRQNLLGKIGRIGMKDGGAVKGGFPDLTGDGKVTKKDILKGRGVKGFKGGGCVMPGRGRSRAMMKK